MTKELSPREIVLAVAAVAVTSVIIATSGKDGGEVARTIAIVSLAVGVPGPLLLTLIHELGHAVAAVALTGQRVTVVIGREPSVVRFALGRIDVRWDPKGYLAHCRLPLGVSAPRLLVLALAGPAASIALAAVLGLWALELRGEPIPFWILAVLAGAALLEGLANLVPLRNPDAWWPGSHPSDEEGPSDDYRVLVALRAILGRAGPPPAPETVTVELATPAVRRAVSRADEEAGRLGCGHIATEHLLVGLLGEPDTVAARTLVQAGASLETLRTCLQPAAEQVDRPPQGRLATPAARRTLRRARDARSLRGDELVDTDHVLVALLQEREGQASELLTRAGIDPLELTRASIAALRRGMPTRRGAASGVEGAAPSP